MGCTHSKKKTTNQMPNSKVLQVERVSNPTRSSEKHIEENFDKRHTTSSSQSLQDSSGNKTADPTSHEGKMKDSTYVDQVNLVRAEQHAGGAVVEIPADPAPATADVATVVPSVDAQEERKQELERRRLKEERRARRRSRDRRHKLQQKELEDRQMKYDHEYIIQRSKQRELRRARAYQERDPTDDTLYEIPTRMPDIDYTKVF